MRCFDLDRPGWFVIAEHARSKFLYILLRFTSSVPHRVISSDLQGMGIAHVSLVHGGVDLPESAIYHTSADVRDFFARDRGWAEVKGGVNRFDFGLAVP